MIQKILFYILSHRRQLDKWRDTEATCVHIFTEQKKRFGVTKTAEMFTCVTKNELCDVTFGARMSTAKQQNCSESLESLGNARQRTLVLEWIENTLTRAQNVQNFYLLAKKSLWCDTISWKVHFLKKSAEMCTLKKNLWHDIWHAYVHAHLHFFCLRSVTLGKPVHLLPVLQ